jgi:site-specific DNA-methyltransferase (adenine-specific)
VVTTSAVPQRIARTVVRSPAFIKRASSSLARSPSLVIVHGDARLPSTYEAAFAPKEDTTTKLDKKKASLLFTDPPYLLLTRRRRGGEERDAKPHARVRKLDHDAVIRFENVGEYRSFTKAWLEAALPHVAVEAPLIIWSNMMGRAPILSAAAELGYNNLVGEFAWAKLSRETKKSTPLGPGSALSLGNTSSELLLRLYEVALVITREPLPLRTNSELPLPWSVVTGYHDMDEEHELVGRRTEKERPVPHSHPHHKPAAAIRPLLLAWSRPGDLVLDPFSGSHAIGNVAVAAGRSAVGIEMRGDMVHGGEGKVVGMKSKKTRRGG